MTENSASVVDLLFVANTESSLLLDVGEPCLNLNMRYHCPVYGVFNFIKPKYKCSDRTVWKYDRRDYENLRRNHDFDWNSMSDNNVDKYADNLTEVLSNVTKLFILPPKKRLQLIHMNHLGSHAILNEKIDRGKDFIVK